MYYIHICFGVVLISILSHGDATETSKHLVITSEITGARGLRFESNESGRDKKGRHEYDYILKYKIYNDVHLVCENTKYSQNDTLQWKILYNQQTTCLKQHRNKIHYINRLEGTQNKAILTCEDGNKHFTSVKMICTNCYGVTTGKTLLLNCLPLNKTTPIATYINGESKTLQERRHQYNLGTVAHTTATVYCQTEYGVFWDWRQSTVPQEATKTISSSDNLVGLTVNLTEAMDGTTLICTDKETKESVKIIFELTSNFFITINNNTRSYSKVKELQYRTNDSFLLGCKVNIPELVKGTVGVEWLKNDDFIRQCARDVNYNSLNKLENLTCHLTELTEADNNAKIICQLRHILTGLLEKRAIVLKYMEYQEGTTESEDLIDDSYKDMQTDGHDSNNTIVIIIAIIVVAVIIIIIIIVIIYMKCRSGSKNENEVSYYKNMQSSYSEWRAPEVEATYACPADQYETCLTGEHRRQEEAYTTPFVPTLAEMYTQPNKKKAKEPLEYATPTKYVNVLNTGSKLQLDPGYSSISGGNSDTSSETYMYSRIK